MKRAPECFSEKLARDPPWCCRNLFHRRAAFRSIPNRGLGPSVIFFTRHPLLDIGRTVQDRYAPRLASVEKSNTLDVDKIHLLDVQNYQCSAAVDLSLNLVQILRSQFSAESHSRLEPFNLQGHDWRLPILPVILQREFHSQVIECRKLTTRRNPDISGIPDFQGWLR